MSIRSTPRFIALAAATFALLFAASLDAHSGGRIFNPADESARTHGGRILKISKQERGDDAAVRIITPRHSQPDAALLEALFRWPWRREPVVWLVGAQGRFNHHGALLLNKTVVVNQFFDDICDTGEPARLRAGDPFQAGGNMLRVPPEEARCGRHARNRVRLFQRYLGFKRVYKGQVYTGFHKVYSGPRYLNGDY